MTYAQPTQTAVKVEELRLPGLDGMLPGGKVKGRDKAALECLVETYNKVSDKYRRKLEIVTVKSKDVYSEMYDEVKDRLLNKVEFNEDDLKGFIFMRSDQKHLQECESWALGLYSGCLLELLTERNEAAGLPTDFYFNGGGRTLNHLFSNARKAGNIFVNNVKGEYLCSDLGTSGGYAPFVIVANSTGSHVGENCFKGGGKGGLIMIVNHIGYDVGMKIGSGEGHDSKGGDINLVILANNKKSTSCGAMVGQYNSHIGLILVENNEGVGTGRSISQRFSSTGLVLVAKNRGAYIGYEIGKFNDPLGIYKETQAGFIGKLVFYENKGKNLARLASAEKIFDDPESREEYENAMQEYKLKEILDLVNTVTKKTSESDIQKIAEQINSIYKTIEPQLEELKQDAIRANTNSCKS